MVMKIADEKIHVVLSKALAQQAPLAKDLIAARDRHEILRFAQDDTLGRVSC